MIFRSLTLLALVVPLAAAAGPLEDRIAAELGANGYDEVRFERGGGTLTAIASDEDREVRIVYNPATGEVISQTMSVAAAE